MWPVKWELLNINYHCTKFDSYKSCERGDITFIFCHVTLRDHMIKWRYDLVNGNPSTKVIFMLICLAEVEITRFEFFMWLNKKILFKTLDHPFHTLTMVSGNSTEVSMTHFNIYVAVNPARTISCFTYSFWRF